MALHNPNNWHWVNKDVREWTRQWFSDNLLKLEAKEGDVTARISKVVDMTGDVDVSQRKGKVITIFDVKLNLEYSGSAPSADGVIGTIEVPEVAHDTDEDEYVFHIDIVSESKEKQPVKDLVRSKLVPQLRETFSKLSGILIAEHGQGIQHGAGENPSSGFTPARVHPQSQAAKTATPATAQTTSAPGVVNTTTVNDNAEFRTTAEQLYLSFTEPDRLAAFTRAPPKVWEGAKVGGKFELFDGNVAGEFVELQPHKKIVQKWRLSQWPKDHFSTLQIDFDQNDVDAVTVLRVTWNGVPIGQEDVTKENWGQYYVQSIKRTFGFGTYL